MLPFQATGFAGLLAALACAWLLWRKEGRFYRWFAPLSAIGLGGLLCAALLQGDEVWRQFQSAFAGQSFAYFLWPLTAMVVGAAAVSAIAELAGQELERRMEARELAERNAMAVASYESLRAQHEQVMMIRHDINRHLHVLRQLSQENAVQAYLDELIGQNEKIPAILHSGNSMIRHHPQWTAVCRGNRGHCGGNCERAGPGKPAPERGRFVFADAQPH